MWSQEKTPKVYIPYKDHLKLMRELKYQPVVCNKGKYKNSVFLSGTAYLGWKQSRSLLEQEINVQLK